MLVVLGAFLILYDGDLIYGLINIVLGLVVGTDSWAKLFKKK